MLFRSAYVSLMKLENVRILKEMRNSVNRKVNCETANISKTVNAAVKQIEDIRLIQKMRGLDDLPRIFHKQTDYLWRETYKNITKQSYVSFFH